MNLLKWFISLSLVLFSISAYAEYYKYIDKNGNVHYTDNLTDVPENQRTDVNEYNEIQSGAVDRQKDEENAKTPETSIEEKQAGATHDANDFSEMKQRLDRKKVGLKKEYNALMDEKKQLQEQKDKSRSRTAARKYNKAVLKYNEKIEDYQRRKIEFDAEVEKYNDQVEKSYLNELEKRKKAKEEQ